MTLDDTTLARGLRDLAATAPDNPARLSDVHRLARRRRRRQRAVGAGALAATMAAAVVGAEALASTGRRPNAAQPASGGTAASGGTPAARPPASGPVLVALPTCPPAPATQPTNKSVAPPSVGEQFSGGGVVSAPGTATTVRVTVQGGPLAGSEVTLTIGPSSKVYIDDRAATGAELQEGLAVKFSATMVTTATYLLDELHAGTPSAVVPKQGAPGVATPPPVGGPFKVAGAVTASTPGTITVDVQGGSLPAGPVTFTLQCSPAGPVVGRMVSVVGTRTGESSYTASLVVVEGS